MSSPDIRPRLPSVICTDVDAGSSRKDERFFSRKLTISSKYSKIKWKEVLDTQGKTSAGVLRSIIHNMIKRQDPESNILKKILTTKQTLASYKELLYTRTGLGFLISTIPAPDDSLSMAERRSVKYL